MTESLSLTDVRALLRLLGEVRELGESPSRWRSHLAEELSRLCAARAVVSSELSIRTPASESQRMAARDGSCQAAAKPLAVAHAGVGLRTADAFFRDVIWYDHASDATLERLVPLYGSTFVRSRTELAEDATWYRSDLASERFRRQDCDDFIIAMCAVPPLGAICSLELFRPWGGAPFGQRERLIVQLVHEELARDFRASCEPALPLSPRQRQVLGLLRRGLSEKQVAAELSVSPHTVHDYVKALYRLHRVTSRAELFAKLTVAPRSLAKLIANGSSAQM